MEHRIESIDVRAEYLPEIGKYTAFMGYENQDLLITRAGEIDGHAAVEAVSRDGRRYFLKSEEPQEEYRARYYRDLRSKLRGHKENVPANDVVSVEISGRNINVDPSGHDLQVLITHAGKKRLAKALRERCKANGDDVFDALAGDVAELAYECQFIPKEIKRKL